MHPSRCCHHRLEHKHCWMGCDNSAFILKSAMAFHSPASINFMSHLISGHSYTCWPEIVWARAFGWCMFQNTSLLQYIVYTYRCVYFCSLFQGFVTTPTEYPRSSFGKHTCPICSKSFVQKSHFTRHMRAHQGHYSFPCGLCGKGFMDNYKLKRHVVYSHGGRGLDKLPLRYTLHWDWLSSRWDSPQHYWTEIMPVLLEHCFWTFAHTRVMFTVLGYIFMLYWLNISVYSKAHKNNSCTFKREICSVTNNQVYSMGMLYVKHLNICLKFVWTH